MRSAIISNLFCELSLVKYHLMPWGVDKERRDVEGVSLAPILLFAEKVLQLIFYRLFKDMTRM